MTEAPPPVALLVFFDAAARHLSFKKAGEELGVTSSAVSQRIAELEDRLRLKLFVRGARSLKLTPPGELYANVAAEVIERHRSGFADLKRVFGNAALRINVAPFVAHNVLIPRIGEFHRLHPDVDLRIETSMQMVDLRRELVDASIRFGDGEWDDVTSRHLVDAVITPACSPAFAEKLPRWTLTDVFQGPLITTDSDANDWRRFGAAVAHEGPPPSQTVVASSHLEASVLAAQGLGFALGFLPIMRGWFDDGRLVAPSDVELSDAGLGYYGVCLDELDEDPRVEAFFSWASDVLAELSRDTPGLSVVAAPGE
ncbi:MAG: LysR substrate-binding domain-containing protein [Myxococcota bacterium]